MPLMSNAMDKELARIRVVLFVMLAAFLFLTGVLWRTQVRDASTYSTSLDRQSMRRVRLPAMRGRIFDRKGVCLAENRPSYNIAIYIEELKQFGGRGNLVDKVETAVDKLSKILNTEKQITRKDISRHVRMRLPLPMLIWRDVSEEALARFEESNIDIPGAVVHIEPIRIYPKGDLAAHILGYVGRADPKQDPDRPYHFYLPEMKGARGIEALMDGTLAGVPGGKLIRVDASGFKYEENEKDKQPPLPGEDIVLTIDSDIQRLLDDSLKEVRGAAVIIDPRNGDVVAMSSSPTFNPNLFAQGISSKDWSGIITDKTKPLLNRAVAEVYAPGSIFKPVVAIAALANAGASKDTTYNCPGYYDLGGARFRCWKTSGHGRISMRKAIEQSCNAYFCQLGYKLCGHERIIHMADALGLGHKTGIDLPHEVPGLLPDNDWKVQHFKDKWRGGDTCNMSIGQGALSVTPLQMAVFAAALANEGSVYRPRLLYDFYRREGDRVNKIAWSVDKLSVVRDGMFDVVQATTGTGKRARIEAVEMAGKTGTAEYGSKSARKKYAWMIVFAPFEEPKYAAVMVIENAVSGGVSVGPRMKTIMEGVFDLEKQAEEEASELLDGSEG